MNYSYINSSQPETFMEISSPIRRSPQVLLPFWGWCWDGRSNATAAAALFPEAKHTEAMVCDRLVGSPTWKKRHGTCKFQIYAKMIMSFKQQNQQKWTIKNMFIFGVTFTLQKKKNERFPFLAFFASACIRFRRVRASWAWPRLIPRCEQWDVPEKLPKIILVLFLHVRNEEFCRVVWIRWFSHRAIVQ